MHDNSHYDSKCVSSENNYRHSLLPFQHFAYLCDVHQRLSETVRKCCAFVSGVNTPKECGVSG